MSVDSVAAVSSGLSSYSGLWGSTATHSLFGIGARSASQTGSGGTGTAALLNNQRKQEAFRYQGVNTDVAPEMRDALVITTANARSALDSAYQMAGDILDALDDLRDTASTARNALLARSTTDYGALGLDVRGNYLLTTIDRSAESAEVDGVNFLTSGGAFTVGAGIGGAVQLSPQPLDIEGLGLSGISLATEEDASAAVDVIDRARTLAVQRTRELAELANALAMASSYDQVSRGFADYSASAGQITGGFEAATYRYSVIDLMAGGGTGALPRGSLANAWG